MMDKITISLVDNAMALESLLSWDKKNKSYQDFDSYSFQKDCGECIALFQDYHWCAHNNVCHTKGSWYGF